MTSEPNCEAAQAPPAPASAPKTAIVKITFE